ncbi:unnamed protein product [Caenorhabditis brenneri]
MISIIAISKSPITLVAVVLILILMLRLILNKFYKIVPCRIYRRRRRTWPNGFEFFRRLAQEQRREEPRMNQQRRERSILSLL